MSPTTLFLPTNSNHWDCRRRCSKSLMSNMKLIYCLISFPIFIEFCSAAATMSSTQSISDGNTLVSSGQTFELGFFSPGNSKNRYLGIWYKNTPGTVVWVANRNDPITDSFGVLTISKNRELVLLNRTKGVVWSSNLSAVAESPVTQLLESGNLVVRDNTSMSSESYLWESFDYPCDTMLPGMKIGCNLNTGVDRYLTSWKSTDDPSPGDFTYRVDILGMPQLFVTMGSIKKVRIGGPWNGVQFSGLYYLPNSVFKIIFISNEKEFFYMSELKNNAVLTRFTLNQSGLLQRLILNERSTVWSIMYTRPRDPCDSYGQCGANAVCRINTSPMCECLKGFTPKSQEEWARLNWSSGCRRTTLLDCQSEEGFMRLVGLNLPDLLEFSLNESMSLKECKAECLKNCSCTAYANLNISGGGSGCLMWFGDLIDIHEFIVEDSEEDIYIRLPAWELESIHHSDMKKRLVIILVVLTILGMLIFGFIFWCVVRRRRSKRRGRESKKEDLELPSFDLATIAMATDNFSHANMIGAGGFGPVYKGDLSTGQEIAVKRLSKNSGQGFNEFMNEVVLIAKLQHRNLVRLLGSCIQGEERMLIYEYMPNKSLDYFIFDENRSALLAWQKRFDIVMGITRGLLYLHQDSRLQIIHRDLKISNILLDSMLNPKISDFGLARIFEGDEIEAKTKRIVGTYGYMSPEYAIDGNFSMKSDVFSLGVLLIEIVSGKKNRGFYHPDHHHNLLGHAWLLWNEDRALELLDTCLEDSCVESQVVRCIQVGLLCVQKFPEDRPAMSSVVFMLANEGAILPQPKQPGFFIERSSLETAGIPRKYEFHTQNSVTISMLEGR